MLEANDHHSEVSIQLFDGYMTEDEMARQRSLSKRTLRNERARGDGPPFVRINHRALYRIDAFREWLKSREQKTLRRGKAA